MNFTAVHLPALIGCRCLKLPNRMIEFTIGSALHTSVDSELVLLSLCQIIYILSSPHPIAIRI